MLRLPIALLFLATPALAEVTITDARLVAAFPNAKAGALYLTLKSDAGDMMIGVHADDAMAMLHETVEDDGVMRMEHVGEIAVQADEPLVMEPGGLHVMMMGLTPEMLEAETVEVRLIFREQGEVPVEARVQIGVHAEGKTE